MSRKSAMAKATEFVEQQASAIGQQVAEVQQQLTEVQTQLDQVQAKLTAANDAVQETIGILKEELAEDF